MANQEKNVVVEDDDRRISTGWAVLIIVAILVVLFLMFNGFGLFSTNDTPVDESQNTGNQTQTTTPVTP